MDRKNLILAAKAALLVSVLGFCIPLFDSSNGFAAILYFFKEPDGFLYTLAGISLSVMFVMTLVSILHSTVWFVTLKKTAFSSKRVALEWLNYAVMIISGIISFVSVKHFPEEVVDFSAGLYFIIVGWAASIILFLYSGMLDENLSIKQEESRAYWLLSLPAVIFYFGVMTFPAIFSVFLSMTNYSGGTLFAKGALKFVGLKNYIKVFQDQYFYVSLKNNLWVVLISVFGQLPLGFFLAYILTRGLVKGKDFFQTMIYLPCVISTVVIGILFQSFFSAHGVWTEIMQKINPAYEWSMNNYPMIPVLVVMLWMYTGTYLIIFLANLQKIDPQIMEAATIDGATEWQTLWHIIFPELSGVFVVSAILAISGSLKSFDLIYVMTGGGPAKQTYVLSLYMFDKAFKGAADYPMANTISTIMVVISLILIVVVKTLEKKFGSSEE